MAKTLENETEVSPVDTFGEYFGTRMIGKKVIDNAGMDSLAVSVGGWIRVAAGWFAVKILGAAFGWHDIGLTEKLVRK